ncbi:cilia- and flagella-associated protein 298-like isoform X2 [Amphibalanus amphitrite]|nr:cilia- and flagella-associated protein 298-like isoform X2 [Amphibalanus amphitrite]XP_043225866.1 cilia- and flagella-associated protein 298-like isoform X2 [Amphibalanus amphitrite]XP_043225867.1 cilia- and flagella-associated protein 298-like isoform X2 [Amphibalanus amphitrite]XP_043225868.1 cilia- and flagella-associated protein 298-like isoform X2 [Amphibalanus amphitrite]XP_043225869.1 cilia- and flagella-associated protein 298-like isoform X2 [Amphibalanus amphitrite]XP_043225870.1 
MVRLVIKRGDDEQFLYETSTSEKLDDTISNICTIFNGRLKVLRLVSEFSELAQHGIALPPEMVGLTEDQVTDLKLQDSQADIAVPSGGFQMHADPLGRRNGRAPKDNMVQVLTKARDEAAAIVAKDQARAGVPLTERVVAEALSILRGATMIVYPMGLPPYDPVRMELENREDLSGTQASLQVMDPGLAQLWFSGKEMLRGKTLADYIGKNEKTKLVVKLQKKGQGAPGREPLMTEEEQKKLMAAEFRRQEELKRLERDLDDTHLSSPWADSGVLKRQFHGLNNVSWGPR